jgi:3-deoxy-manno-octulosonate cytidylyltransferase (CMP-KDO synthetase)
MKALGIIPARYASTRFPGKPLVEIRGKSMIMRVYEQASKAEMLDAVVVATDDRRIYNHVTEFNGSAVMTDENHLNGTSRCAEALQLFSKHHGDGFDAVVNIQGDEPFIDPSQVDQVVSILKNPENEIVTLARKVEDEVELFSPDVVKVIFDAEGRANYFSRQAIPFLRGISQQEWIQHYTFYKHIGIYGFRSDVLRKIVKLKESGIEKAEKLEQLRWLENAFRITVGITDLEAISIDTPEDLSKLTNIS